MSRGPTLLDTIVGTSFSSMYLYVGCLALAAGALLYVIGELLPVGRRLSWEVTLWGLLAGFFLGLATERYWQSPAVDRRPVIPAGRRKLTAGAGFGSVGERPRNRTVW